MIRRTIFGKVHGRGVKEIWLINQFPAKHKGVASGPKIVFARPGLAWLLGYGYGVINNEFIIYIAYSPPACENIRKSEEKRMVSQANSPQVTAFRFSETHQLLYDPLRSDFMYYVFYGTGGEVSLQAESWKTPPVEPLRSKHSWLSGKKEGAFKNTK